jgi:hypothetical protein
MQMAKMMMKVLFAAAILIVAVDQEIIILQLEL